MQRAFRQVDVFTTEPGLGNALAVVLEGDGLTTEAMQRFATSTNLSETTFVIPVARWLIDAGRIRAPYVATQGAAIGRAARLRSRRTPTGRSSSAGGA